MTMNDDIKERLSDMAALNQSRTPADALARINELEAKIVTVTEAAIIALDPEEGEINRLYALQDLRRVLAELKGEK